MYHSVSNDLEGSVAPYYRTCVSPSDFAEQMGYLKSLGYRGIKLSDGLAALNGRPVSVAKSVVITFDDGFRNFWTTAVPILHRHNFSATMFLPTAFIGETSRRFKDRDCLCWAEVCELHRCGVEFGSHTVTHRQLVNLNWNEIDRELDGSKAAIEDRVGDAVRSFSYPYAFPQANHDFVIRLGERLQAFGYESCVTTQVGCVREHDNFFSLRRLPVNGCDDVRLLQAKIDGAYDWLGLFQAASKQMKTFASRTCHGLSRFALLRRPGGGDSRMIL